MAQPSNTFDSYDAVGIREDFIGCNLQRIS